MSDAPHTASLSVTVHPTGVSGKVLIKVQDTGPERLTPAEMVTVLRQAMQVTASYADNEPATPSE